MDIISCFKDRNNSYKFILPPYICIYILQGKHFLAEDFADPSHKNPIYPFIVEANSGGKWEDIFFSAHKNYNHTNMFNILSH